MHISGIASFSWRYIGLRECIRIARVMMIPSALLLFARLAAPSLRELMPHAIYLQVPIGVVLFNFVGAVAAVIGARILRRILTERYEIKQRRFDRDVTRTVLVGAGHGGLLIAREIEQRPELGIEAVGFWTMTPENMERSSMGFAYLARLVRCESFGSVSLLSRRW